MPSGLQILMSCKTSGLQIRRSGNFDCKSGGALIVISIPLAQMEQSEFGAAEEILSSWNWSDLSQQPCIYLRLIYSGNIVGPIGWRMETSLTRGFLISGEMGKAFISPAG